jgi:hypothetical protein
MADTAHGSKISWKHRPDSERWPELSIRKVPASSVPFGESISRNGRTVWAGYHNGELVAVGATCDQTRAKYKNWWYMWRRAEGDRKNVDS